MNVSEPVRRAALTTAAGQAWLDDLPGVLATLEQRWGITVREALTGGSASYVAAAVTSDGRRAVVKVALPPGIEGLGAFHAELDAVLVGGSSYAAVLAHDRDLNAVLLERLGPSLRSLDLPIREQLTIIGTALRESWVATDVDIPLLTGKAAWFTDYIQRTWEATSRPCTPQAVELALSIVARRTDSSAPPMLLHGDAHASNVLQAHDGTFRLIDPDPVIGDPAYDLAIPIRELSAEDLGDDPPATSHELCALLAEPAGIDPQAVWDWGFVERMSTGLLCTKLGHDDWGQGLLAIADRLAL